MTAYPTLAVGDGGAISAAIHPAICSGAVRGAGRGYHRLLPQLARAVAVAEGIPRVVILDAMPIVFKAHEPRGRCVGVDGR